MPVYTSHFPRIQTPPSYMVILLFCGKFEYCIDPPGRKREREREREIKVAGRLYEIIMLSVMNFELTIQWSVVRERGQSGWKAV